MCQLQLSLGEVMQSGMSKAHLLSSPHQHRHLRALQVPCVRLAGKPHQGLLSGPLFSTSFIFAINPLLLGIARTLWLLSQVPGQPRTANGVFVLRCSVRCRQHLLGGFQALQRSSGVQKGSDQPHGCCTCVVSHFVCFLTCEFIHFFSLHRLCSCATAGVTPQDALADNNPWDFCGFDGTPRMEHGLLDVQLRSL